MLLGSSPLGAVALGELPASASSGTTINAVVGHIVVTGKATSLNIKKQISATLGHVVVTGKSTNIIFGYNISPAVGHIVVTGKATSLNVKRNISTNLGHILLAPKTTSLNIKRNISTALGHIVVTGKTTTITYGGGVNLTPAVGHIVVTGKSTSLNVKKQLNTTLGHILLAPKATTISYRRNIAPAVGHVILTPNSTSLNIKRNLNNIVGHIIVTAYPITSSPPPVEPEVAISVTIVTIEARIPLSDFYPRRYIGPRMTNINRLSSVTALTNSDLFPVWTEAGGDTRKASLSTIKDFINASVTAADDKVTQFSSPSATGFTVTLADDGDSKWLVLTPAAGYAAGTITLPAVANCVDKQEVLVNSTQAITTLTIGDNGATVTGAPTTMAANAFFTLRFDAVMSKWYRVG